ncbi:MAG: ribonuclease D [Planctomycetota bacterium]|nr:MAG: ribonuclease D [Planctomycetota bacterium]
MPKRIPSEWGSVRMVETPDQLDQALKEWRQAEILGVDTEANSFFAYHDRLCLMQVSTARHDYVVDPIPLGEALREVNSLLADPDVVKIFHAAEYDLMLLNKDLGAEVRGLFDTQVAMTFLEKGKTGLAALIEKHYGFSLSKKEQRSNWGKRPLTEEQVAYARIDTHFLPDLYDRLLPELKQRGLFEAARGEFQRLEREILSPRQPDMEAWRRFKGARQLSPEAAARLRALFQWREKLASREDLPPFRILANPTLMELAERPPKEMAELAKRKGVGWRKARTVGQDILQALRAVAGQKTHDHVGRRISSAERKVKKVKRENQEALRRWRKQMADNLELPPERLMHRRHLEAIGEKLPRDRETLLRLVHLTDWQRENLEPSLLELLAQLPDPGKLPPAN